MENSPIMISVIIPLYNKVSFVERTLRSVFVQTYSDYEVIIVDDGSTDGSAELVEKLIEDRDNYRLVRQSNVGVGAARNNGAEVSKGEYLCFLDADDWWKPEFLEGMLEFAHQYPDARLWACNYIYYKPGKTHIGVKHPTGYMNYPKCYYENVGMPVWTGAVMVTRRVFDEMGGFPVGIKLGEDFLLWSKIALRYKIAFLNKALTYYNNDVPASLRATRNLHKPENHMLWHVDDLVTDDEWKRLIDWLRVSGLMDYWLSREYHEPAKVELEKVDWDRQPKSVIRRYRMPRWIMRWKNRFKVLGSFVKNRILKNVKLQRISSPKM